MPRTKANPLKSYGPGDEVPVLTCNGSYFNPYFIPGIKATVSDAELAKDVKRGTELNRAHLPLSMKSSTASWASSKKDGSGGSKKRKKTGGAGSASGSSDEDSGNKRRSTRTRGGVEDTAPARERRGGRPPSRSASTRLLSPQLAAVCGFKRGARSDVVLALWDYIERHALEETSNRGSLAGGKKQITCDELLRACFGAITYKEQIMDKLAEHLQE